MGVKFAVAMGLSNSKEAALHQNIGCVTKLKGMEKKGWLSNAENDKRQSLRLRRFFMFSCTYLEAT